jgi:hypothetical protein|tara:strand:+ start:120 stop:506 length:387 start_codon:yes stop_codon:yes gene_type:complete
MSEKIKLGSNRGFGIVFFVVFALIGVYPLINNGELRLWSILLSLIFLVLGLINSNILKPLNVLWFKFGLFLGKIVSPLILGFIFFIVVTPTGILVRFFKKDLLNLKFHSKKSYWIEKSGPKSKMKNQF